MANRVAPYRYSNGKSPVAEKSLILFDGVCNLCNGFVTFLIPRDRKNHFQFGSLQSPKVIELLRAYHYMTTELSTVILIEDDKLYTRSTAVLRIARRLGGIWVLAYPLILLPSFLRDWLYDLVARNRYRFFGRKDTCMIPRPEWRDRFVD